MTAPALPQLESVEATHLDCIHCGICLSVCPTYLHLGNEADSPRGRIYLIKALEERRLAGAGPTFQRHMQLCLECRACETACPSGVVFSKMMDGARIEIYRQRKLSAAASFLHWFIFRKVFPSRRLMHLCFRLLRCYQLSGMRRLVRATGILKLFSGRLVQMEALLPDIPRSPKYAAHSDGSHGARRPALLFEGCIMPELFGPIHEATIRVLEHNGIAVRRPARQTCCGALHMHQGDLETAQRLARSNISAFESSSPELILVNAAGCGAMLREYDQLLAGDPVFAQRARDFSSRVRDISEYLDEIGIDLNMERLEWTVTYDDPCHLLHAQGIKAAPRNLLRAIPGLQLVEMRDADRCCGSAGIYNLTHPEMSARILDEKIANIIRSGAQVVATGNPGCLLQIQSGLRARHLPIRAMHPIELLDLAYQSPHSNYRKGYSG